MYEVSILGEALFGRVLPCTTGLNGTGDLEWVMYFLMPGQVPSKFAATDVADDLNDVEHE